VRGLADLSLAVLAVCALASSAGAQTDVRKAIQAQYNRWSKAYMANDVDTLLDVLLPEYTLTGVDKNVMTYATYRAYLDLKRKTPKTTTRYSTSIHGLTVHGNDADVDSIESMVTEKRIKSGPLLVSTHLHEYIDKWRFSGKTWRLASTVTIKESNYTVKRP
jgi:hypothetical protein